MSSLASSLGIRLRGVRAALASVLFPAPCRICGEMLDTGIRIPFCHACLSDLTKPLPEPLCPQCGLPVGSSDGARGGGPPECHTCRLGAYDFDLARSYGVPSLSNNSEVRIGLQLAQEELAQLLGASRQRVNQELKAMEREDAIRIETAGLVVRSREILLRISDTDLEK